MEDDNSMCVKLALDRIHAEHLALAHALDWPKVDQLADLVKASRRVFTLGRGRSGLVMAMFAMRLMHLGKLAHVVGEATTPAASAGDLLIVASASGETESVCRLTETARDIGVSCVGFSTRADSLLARTLECCAVIPAGDKRKIDNSTRQFAGTLFEQAVLLITDAIVLRLADQSASWTTMSRNHANIE